MRAPSSSEAGGRRPASLARVRHPERVLRAYLALQGTAFVLSALDLSDALNGLLFLVVGVSTGVALLAGPRLHRTPDRATWNGLALTCLVFAIGGALRPLNEGATGALVALPDAFTLPGYLVLFAAVLRLLRHRRREGDEHALLDTLIIVLGAGLVAVTVLVAPALESANMPTWFSLIMGTYPVLDVVLLALLVQLRFTSDRTPSFTLLSGAFVGVLVGDVGYAWVGRTGELVPPHVVDLPFLLAYALIGWSALHPSMPSLGRVHGRVVQSWSGPRLGVLVPALLTPSALLVVHPASTGVRVVQGVGAAAIVCALLLRAGAAVREQARSRRVFEQLATHDDLTGLPNRLLLSERLDALVASGHQVSVHFLDLDGFKMVNDSWGHAVGDELLVQVAERLRRLPREVLVARAGGDEFVLVVPVTAEDPDGTRLAAGVITDLSRPYGLSVAEIVVTPSIGVAGLTSSDEPSAQALVRDADTAMYAAKAAGRGHVVVFDVSMRGRVRERIELDVALRRAFTRGELDVHYQPVHDLVTGRVLGFEALLRWERGRGAAGPAVFVPVAEENGLIVEIGEWVLGQALDQLVRWRSETPLDVAVSVNVSTKQLAHEGFAALVEAALLSRDLPPSALRLEITESGLVTGSPQSQETLRLLAEIGVALSVDDFGTGYSSLSYLSRLRVHELKIDRSFVCGLGVRREDEAIVRATAAMARTLGLAVVAEGIETPEQRDCLVGMGVEQGQGYLLGRPVPAREALALVSRGWREAPTL